MSFTVTYNPNGAASGTVPTDPNIYPVGATVTVLGNPGKLLASNGYFLNWNTAANGTGTILNPGATFPITANTILFAQLINIASDSTSNLTNGGLTPNFAVQYPIYTGIPAAQLAPIQANLIANANYLLSGTPAQIETAFATCTGWFATPASKFGASNRQSIILDLVDNGGAYNTGYPNPIHTDGQYLNASLANAGPEVAMVFAAEFAEVLMSIAGNWNAGDSSGEGLSQYSACNLFPAGYLTYYGGSFIQAWLNGTGSNIVTNQGTPSPNAARSDFVNTTYTGSTVSGIAVHGDGDPVSFGCALGFIYYLTVQLGFTINQVISTYSGTLASCYHSLTGDTSDPFPIFANLIASAYPAGTSVTSLPGANPQNPFPIAEVQFYIQKNTYGKDETQDIIDNLGGLVIEAFWVVITGFSQNSFQSLGITVASFTGTFAALQTNSQGLTITPNPLGAQFENGVNATTPQTIRIPFDITLSTPILSQFPATGVSPPYILTASLTSNGAAVTGSTASTEFEFIAGADPYFTNVDATNNQPYLSQDLRVFQAAPAFAGQKIPFPNGPTFGTDSIDGAYTYIQALLDYLNNTPDFTNPNGIDPFSLLPDQQGEGQTDSSVAPYAVNQNPFQTPFIANNYNFAIARVRLRGTGTVGSPATAENVRVFFRVFGTSTNDTDFDPSATGTYASQPDAAGHPGTPIFGGVAPNNVTTMPFFATGNPGAETDYQTNGYNNKTLIIPIGQHDLYHYYGCFLNFYDPAYEIANQQIQVYLPGTHHCLVAQIAFDDAPIPVGVPATSWDQLAQRNLQFTTVDNPGPIAAHRAPQTFDTRPSTAIGQPGGLGTPPDELMIEWGNIPAGATASLYWPGVAAADVIALLREWGGTAPITASDAHTLAIPIHGGITYIPIPTGTGQNFAGLFTMELPIGIKTGQLFEVLVRRVSTRRFVAPAPPPPPPILQTAPAQRGQPAYVSHEIITTNAVSDRASFYRYIVGTFVVRIPVSTSAAMLAPEATTLAIMKWRLANMSPSNRWVPVLERYIAYSSTRLNAVGGDAGSVPASLTYIPPSLLAPGRGGAPGETTTCGKVSEVLFDCHGDFIGFALDNCCDPHAFETRERAIGDLALRACQLNLRLCVTVDKTCNRITRLAITP
ncbi:MAG TPA: InlB B-repeat-containing protein [Acetobacteraceae bacterium]|jgi:hypothetical protein|nr:InlB B-repeat-containing protein [Acetobacteraceae bacterium]